MLYLMYRKEEDKMYYTIGEVAKMFNLTPSTIRYYDKEGLLHFVERQFRNTSVF